MYIIGIVATAAAFTCFSKGKKDRLFTVNVNNLWSYSAFLIVHQNALNEFRFVKIDYNLNPVKKHFLINPSILLYYVTLFHQIILYA